VKFFLDTEFIEDGKTIDLISIGLVWQAGKDAMHTEYYAISTEFDASKASDWVKENVLSKLPSQDNSKNLFKSRAVIAEDIKNIVKFNCELAPKFYGTPTTKAEFYGYYSSYDWVALCQLFGTMMDLPSGFPKYCRDIKQIADMMGVAKLPELDPSLEHSALEDARWNRRSYEFLVSANRLYQI
jgi:hypothetical protein